MVTSNNENMGPEHASTPVGQYYLLDKIAQGGMAEIYRGMAYDLHGIKRTVVIKKILPHVAADPEFVNMLINEAKIAVMLSHGNIAQIYDLGKVENDYFMVMEFVDGKSLSQIHRRCLKNGHLMPIEYACYFVSEVASGLNYMHRKSDESGRNLGIIHRDISPQNVIVSYSGTIKIIDFGIAKAAIQMNITDSGILKGKFAYMSPEQAKGESVDHRSDIFSLGVILHELLTGKRLFKGKNKKETLQNVRKAHVPHPSSLNKDLDEEMDKIVLKALAEDPRERYLWASDLRNDITKFLHINFPDFKSSSIGDFVSELFKDELAEKGEMEEDAKTPFLIIDHTQSAILPEGSDETGIIKVPPQLRGFMFDDETPIPKKVTIENNREESKTTGKKPLFGWSKITSFFETKWQTVVGVLFCAAIIAIAPFVILVNRGILKVPSYLVFLTPSTKIIISVEPKDAKVTLNDEVLPGKSTYKIKVTPGTEYRVIAEKDDYLTFLKSITLKKGQKERLDVVLEPEPSHYAELSITSTPSGAKVFLNEKETNLETPATVGGLKPGDYHSIGLFLEDYIYWNRDILFKRDEKKKLNVDLEVNYGRIDIDSTPNGARVLFDGKFIGTTPLVRGKIKPGEVIEISLEKEGFLLWKTRVKVKAGKTVTLRPAISRTKEYLRPKFLRDYEESRKDQPNIY